MDHKQIKRFDMSQIKDNFRAVAIGKSRSGKSIIIKDVLYHKKNTFPVCQVFSESDDVNGFFSSFIPSSFIFKEYSDVVLGSTFDRQSKIIKKNLENPNNILIFDDAVTDSTTLNKAPIKRLFKFGRQYHLSTIIALQGLMDLNANFRNLIDYVFIFNDSSVETRKKLYKYYAGAYFKDQAEFEQAMDIGTQDYHILIIDNTSTSNKFQDRVFFYKADPNGIPEDWKLGCESFWDYHRHKFAVEA